MAASMSLKGRIKRSVESLTDFILLYGVEGVGKTTLPAYADSPLFVTIGREKGLQKLMDQGRVPADTPFLEVPDWGDLRKLTVSMTTDPELKKFKTVAFDSASTAEELCQTFVCNRDFRGDWTENGFAAFQKGLVQSCKEWESWLDDLVKLRDANVNVVLIAHATITPFTNPDGADYDRYTPQLDKRVWGSTHKTADMVLFMRFNDVVNTAKAKDKKGKASGGDRRLLCAARTAAHDAKNRHGLPDRMSLSSKPETMWRDLQLKIQASKQAAQAGNVRTPDTDEANNAPDAAAAAGDDDWD